MIKGKTKIKNSHQYMDATDNRKASQFGNLELPIENLTDEQVDSIGESGEVVAGLHP